MKILQIGRLNWASQVEKLPEDLEWLFCEPEYIQNFLKLEEEKLLAESMKRMVKHDVLLEKPKIHIHFNAIVITDYLEELQLEPLMNTIEAYSLFCSAELELSSTSSDGIFRRKMLRKLERSRDISSCINFLNQVLFSSQYGAKLKIPEIDINPGFEGIVQRNGHVNTQFTGNFGENFQQLFTYRYNLSSFPVALELWQEFEKIKGNCQIQLEITPMRRGSLYALMDSFTYNEDELKDPIILEPKPEEIGFYVVSIYARGVGSLTFGPLHWRYSRQGLGNLVLGGGRFSDERRQEFFYYFNPGDMKPPLNVYFSGFRPAEGFEGFGMMKAFNSPFMLIADPRLEGGCFYIGTDQYEEKIIEVNDDRAKRCAFMVQTRTEEEWSTFTKRLNIWKAKESEIFKHERKMAELDWDDFNDADINLITMLANQYSSEMVENSEIITVKEKKFVVSKINHEKIIQNHMERLEKLAKKPKLYNPVFVRIDDEGELVLE